jgi:hypothetical protein
MAAKKRRKAEKPEKVIGAVKAGKVEIDTAKLAAFRKELRDMGIQSPKVQFVARNAPFMRRPAI